MPAAPDAWRLFASAVIEAEALTRRLTGLPPRDFAGLVIDDEEVDRLLTELPGLDGPPQAELAPLHERLRPMVEVRRMGFLESLAGGGTFAAIARNARLSVADAEVLALVAAVELSPQLQRLVGYLQDNVNAPRLWLSTLARLDATPEALRSLAPDAPLRRGELVHVDDDGAWATRVTSLAEATAWTLAGAQAPDRQLPRRMYVHELGAEVAFNRSATTFDGVVALVAKGEADVGISKLSITLPRAAQVRFTQPYIELAQGLLLNRVELTAAGGGRNTDVIAVLNQPGRRLGAVKGTSYVGFGHTLFPDAELVEFPDKEGLFKAVLDGAVTGVLYDENEIKQYIFEQPDRLINLKVEMLSGHTDPIAIAVRDPQLQYWLNTYLGLKRVKFAVNDLLNQYPRP